MRSPSDLAQRLGTPGLPKFLDAVAAAPRSVSGEYGQSTSVPEREAEPVAERQTVASAPQVGGDVAVGSAHRLHLQPIAGEQAGRQRPVAAVLRLA
jgi:hypothetical protein